MSKLTILHTESSMGWGGQEMRILKEALGMKERGHRVLLAVEMGAKLFNKAVEAGVEAFEVPFSKWRPFKAIRALSRIIDQYQVSIINTHSSLDAWIGGVTSRIKGKPVIRTRHLSTAIQPGLNSRLLYQSLADYVVTTSSCIIPMICKQAKIDPYFCRCIPTGVNPEDMKVQGLDREMFRRQLGLSEEDFIAGTVCVVRSWKGVEDLIRAAAYLKEEKHLKWVVVGGGYLDQYRRLVEQIGLEKTVLFTGHLENPFPALAAMDLFLLLSTKNEGISQASLQAAFLNKPLITTSVGGLPEVCIEGTTGFVVPPSSPQRVANAVLQIKNNEPLRLRFGQNGHELVMEKFTHRGMLDEMESIYDEISLRGRGC